MNVDQLHALVLRETDVQGAIYRFCGDEQLYIRCLQTFLDDTTLEDLALAIKNEHWDDAFTAAHALKGLAGNMGFVPLMHATGQLVVSIRGGRIKESQHLLLEVESCHRDIKDAIHQFMAYQTKEGGKENENRAKQPKA